MTLLDCHMRWSLFGPTGWLVVRSNYSCGLVFLHCGPFAVGQIYDGALWHTVALPFGTPSAKIHSAQKFVVKNHVKQDVTAGLTVYANDGTTHSEWDGVAISNIYDSIKQSVLGRLVRNQGTLVGERPVQDVGTQSDLNWVWGPHFLHLLDFFHNRIYHPRLQHVRELADLVSTVTREVLQPATDLLQTTNDILPFSNHLRSVKLLFISLQSRLQIKQDFGEPGMNNCG